MIKPSFSLFLDICTYNECQNPDVLMTCAKYNGKRTLQNCCFLCASKMYNCTIKTFLHDPSAFLTMHRYRWEKYKMMSFFHRNVQQRFVGQILLNKGHELRIYVKIVLYQLLLLPSCLMMDLTTMTEKYI